MKSFAPLLTLSLSLLFGLEAQARMVHTWRFEEIADKAEVLATGKIVATAPTGQPVDRNAGWGRVLKAMNAKFQVLRLFEPTASGLRSGQTVDLSYQTIDWERTNFGMDVVDFPAFAAGEVWVLPLRQIRSTVQDRWELLTPEDFGCFVPAVESEPAGTPVKTGVDFLKAELANDYAVGDYAAIWRAIRYPHHFSPTNAKPSGTLQGNVVAVGNDEERWLDIAVAAYCSGYYSYLPRLKIADLLKDAPPARAHAAFVAAALRHASQHLERLEDGVIARLIEHALLHPGVTAEALTDNYPHHPATLRLLRQALREGRPAAVAVAATLIKDDANALLPDVLSGARAWLAQHPVALGGAYRDRMVDLGSYHDYNDFPIACKLLRDHGSKADFDWLLGEIEQAQRQNRERYRQLWEGCAYYGGYPVKNPRLIEVCRIVINDDAPSRGGSRYCDMAAVELERLTGSDWGLKSVASTAQRDRYIVQAKDWLARHPRREGG